jgi:hypothetical protein
MIDISRLQQLALLLSNEKVATSLQLNIDSPELSIHSKMQIQLGPQDLAVIDLELERLAKYLNKYISSKVPSDAEPE